jgi:hypothetical protein
MLSQPVQPSSDAGSNNPVVPVEPVVSPAAPRFRLLNPRVLQSQPSPDAERSGDDFKPGPPEIEDWENLVKKLNSGAGTGISPNTGSEISLGSDFDSSDPAVELSQTANSGTTLSTSGDFSRTGGSGRINWTGPKNDFNATAGLRSSAADDFDIADDFEYSSDPEIDDSETVVVEGPTDSGENVLLPDGEYASLPDYRYGGFRERPISGASIRRRDTSAAPLPQASGASMRRQDTPAAPSIVRPDVSLKRR